MSVCMGGPVTGCTGSLSWAPVGAQLWLCLRAQPLFAALVTDISTAMTEHGEQGGRQMSSSILFHNKVSFCLQ